MTTSTFFDHPLQLLLALKDAEDEGDLNFAVVAFLEERGLNREQWTLVLDRLLDDDLVSFIGAKRGDGTYSMIHKPRLTAAGLKQLALWPSGSPDFQLLMEQVLQRLDPAELTLTAEQEEQINGFRSWVAAAGQSGAGGLIARALGAAMGF